MENKSVEAFQQEREELNEIVLKYAQKEIKRFYSLDSQVYRDGALPAKTKELLGLVASLVLRCDDCIQYHIIRSFEEGITNDELEEALAIGLVVGGSITIPHLRRAFRAWDELTSAQSKFSGEKKTALFNSLASNIEKLVTSGMGRDAKLLAVSNLLKEKVPYFDWVGFYLVDPEKEDELVLGPFAGEPTEHVRIPFGKGICGQAAERKETFVIQDVSRESNYLSCSPVVKSEIVVPIMRGNTIVGELDIDSHDLSPFSEQDNIFLNNVCRLLADQLF